MTDAPTDRESVERPVYLIRKNGYFYRPNEAGYTASAIQAGRYTLDDAIKITHPNGPDGPRDGMLFIHEDCVKCSDWDDYRALLAEKEKAEAERDALRASISCLTAAGDAFAAYMHPQDDEARGHHMRAYRKWEHAKQEALTTLDQPKEGKDDE